jgi:hypothetical protein
MPRSIENIIVIVSEGQRAVILANIGPVSENGNFKSSGMGFILGNRNSSSGNVEIKENSHDYVYKPNSFQNITT